MLIDCALGDAHFDFTKYKSLELIIFRVSDMFNPLFPFPQPSCVPKLPIAALRYFLQNTPQPHATSRNIRAKSDRLRDHLGRVQGSESVY